MNDILRNRQTRGGMAMVSAVAFLISGCDTAGPGNGPVSMEKGDSPDFRFDYREGGVDLSKSASDELADFVAAIHFDVVLPMTFRINTMSVPAREILFKRIRTTRSEVEAALNQVKSAGHGASAEDIERLDQANRKMETLLRPIISERERTSLSNRARRILDRHPELRGLGASALRDVLQRSLGRLSKEPSSEVGWRPSTPQVDTGESSDCKMDCSITAAISFGSLELAYFASLFGCSAATAGYFVCVGIVSGLKYYELGSIVWSLYTCTKKC